MFERIRKLLEPKPSPPGMTKSLLRELAGLKPGQAMRLRHESGAEFTVMHSEDFDHIAGLAGLKLRPVIEFEEL